MLARSKRYESRRYDDRNGDPMPAYVVGEYVVEKNRRDWDHREAGQVVSQWAGDKEWWEVRRAASRALPGCSLGRHPLYTGRTLRECIEWIAGKS